MRLRVGVVLCLFAVLWGMGCRKPLTPVVDTNMAPETWITAAPMDSITIRDPQGRPVPGDRNPRKIPVRFHVYWAGADQDGVVAGFFYAVTETTLLDPGSNGLPPVPGPKPRDYHFTTATDTTFIFNVTEDFPDREHAFFIYAVDNKGKADPTPARFLFTAIDNYPPKPRFVMPSAKPGFQFGYARAVGYVVPYAPNLPKTTVPDTVYFNDVNSAVLPPRDTCAANARLDFQWIAELGIIGNDVKRYCYKLDEPEYICGDSSLHAVSYNSGLPGEAPLSVGTKVFHLRATDIAGGGADSTRRVYMNYAPDSWFSGPDVNDPRFVQIRENSTGDIRYIDLTGTPLSSWPGLPGTQMSSDSFTVMPVDRPERRTFFEIWNNRLYAHAEGDTVHMNSWAVFYSGGYDKDSKYRVKVDPLDPALPADTTSTPVLNKRPENGSPIGFRSQLTVREDPFGSTVPFTASGLAPVFLPASVSRLTTIGAYWPLQLSGRAFITTRAEDGDGGVDASVGNPADPVLRGEAGTATPLEQEARHKVIAFYVNKAPFLQSCDPNFIPADPSCPSAPAPTEFHGKQWSLNLMANDVDPFDPNQREGQPVGIPTAGKPLRYKIYVIGQDLVGNTRTWEYHQDGNIRSDLAFFNTFNVTLDLNTKVLTANTSVLGYSSAGDSLATGNVILRVELCDCRECELREGQGVCITRDFPVTYSATLVEDADMSSLRRGRAR